MWEDGECGLFGSLSCRSRNNDASNDQVQT